MRMHTRVAEGSHAYFPGIMLQMADNQKKSCPFLSSSGCSVYKDRPSACRTYPLERGVEQTGKNKRLKSHYFMTHHPYCKGHFEPRHYTVKKWEREQGLTHYNDYNDLWAELDAFFSTNPWQGEGKAGPLQQLAFMVCFNVDEFRNYMNQHDLKRQMNLSKTERRTIDKDDGALLQFGFSWLRRYLGG